MIESDHDSTTQTVTKFTSLTSMWKWKISCSYTRSLERKEFAAVVLDFICGGNQRNANQKNTCISSNGDGWRECWFGVKVFTGFQTQSLKRFRWFYGKTGKAEEQKHSLRRVWQEMQLHSEISVAFVDGVASRTINRKQMEKMQQFLWSVFSTDFPPFFPHTCLRVEFDNQKRRSSSGSMRL